MAAYIKHKALEIAEPLYQFIAEEALPQSETGLDRFWDGLLRIVRELGPRHAELLQIRDQLQAKINAWHKKTDMHVHDLEAYKTYLSEIGYLQDLPKDFQITTENVDVEIAEIAGPQLVAPLDNARYVLNAVNARWASLYDAFYTTDAISEANGCKKVKQYNPIRGERVIQLSRQFLDRHFALERNTHRHVTRYFIQGDQLAVCMGDGTETTLLKPQQFVGYTGDPAQPDEVVLCHHGLHVALLFGEGFFIGCRDHANLYDIYIESAITTVMDCEDAVASVDAEDKVGVYRNWLGLMKGTLARKIEKNDAVIERKMAPDRSYINGGGEGVVLPGRSLMLVRNVGMHLETDSVLLNGQPIPETMLDAMVTSLCAKHDLLGNSPLRNSRRHSIYIVKPKMHGPDEVAHANVLFSRVEKELDLPANTLKMGIMDEERRTSVNLKACILAARERVVFINTGFLDRTGDDIHTNMEAGAAIPKEAIKTTKWLRAYEANNVQIGLQCGLKGRAHIGKGMWALPEEMNAMLEGKICHLKEGANTSWVPSPIAATLHALHYHRLNVHSRQDALMSMTKIPLDHLLDIPILPEDTLTASEVRRELENNAQGMLGYVSRWVGQGIGCSKVPNLNGVNLMEDCATLRITSQHIANWLHHGVISKDEVYEAMKRMAVIVDRQNRDDPNYSSMTQKIDTSLPFQAAIDLVFNARQQANGYTEFILYRYRREQKKQAACLGK